MLVNAKPEHLVKYSKGTYNKDYFVESVKDRWELTDLQIRMTYLISDLAVKANGVFSVTHQNFIKMFEERFKMKVSLSSARRFFALLSKIGVISINGAKRKNNQQSANIYIVEVEVPKSHEQPYEHRHEHLEEQAVEQHNITINKTIKIPLNKPIKNNFVNKEPGNKDEIINKLTNEYRLKGMSKELCLRVLSEVEANPTVQNFGKYFKACLENALYKHKLKRGAILSNSKNEGIVPSFITWIDS
ncbi:hypothetical protein [Falsibacillus albus]|uniref:Uncharacterized protein n=1 Tax=Falsibacillus albus TaxID=2478915 RepID=A0A3L7JGQ3_9BACI|nr:hypothetical protein [Falsibacillus albus]RLQ89958.1 hypothetical protein D9X91_22190 [Falsibacillus albus]